MLPVEVLERRIFRRTEKSRAETVLSSFGSEDEYRALSIKHQIAVLRQIITTDDSLRAMKLFEEPVMSVGETVTVERHFVGTHVMLEHRAGDDAE